MNITRADSKHHGFLIALWEREWGGITMISRGATHHLDSLPSFIAEENGIPIGAATWATLADETEISDVYH